jgi:AcrR family transcriptional regulator
MRRRKPETTARILDAAYALFWRQGFVRVSMDEVAARAGVTKRTLYQHFRSKDDLIAAALSRTSELALARLNTFERPRDAAALVDYLFGELAAWAAKPRWAGLGFTRVVIELADLRGHPARAIARQHKAVVEKWVTGALAGARVKAPQERAREIIMLWEGAVVLALTHGDRSYIAAGALAARALLAGASRSFPRRQAVTRSG